MIHSIPFLLTLMSIGHSSQDRDVQYECMICGEEKALSEMQVFTCGRDRKGETVVHDDTICNGCRPMFGRVRKIPCPFCRAPDPTFGAATEHVVDARPLNTHQLQDPRDMAARTPAELRSVLAPAKPSWDVARRQGIIMGAKERADGGGSYSFEYKWKNQQEEEILKARTVFRYRGDNVWTSPQGRNNLFKVVTVDEDQGREVLQQVAVEQGGVKLMWLRIISTDPEKPIFGGNKVDEQSCDLYMEYRILP